MVAALIFSIEADCYIYLCTHDEAVDLFEIVVFFIVIFI
jgi:hypothetical protein